MNTMNMPRFDTESSLDPTEGIYWEKAVFGRFASDGTAISLSMTPQAAMRRIGLGISYPPTDGGCQICTCTCYPVPC
jgi:hypothetical protein